MPRRKKKIVLPKYVVIKAGQWFVRRTYPTRESYPNGKPKRLEITRKCVPETPERASELAAAIHAAITTEKTEYDRPKSVGEYISAYLTVKKRSVTRRTYEDYLKLFDRYVKDTPFSQIVISNVRTRTLQEYIDSLASAGVSPEMIHKVAVLLSMAFRQAVVWEDLTKNPATGLMLPKVTQKEAVAFTRDETRRLIGVLRQNPDYLIFEFGLETGMRPQELLALTWDKLDIVKCRVKIDRAVSSALKGGGFEIKATKTRSSVRTVSISKYMSDRLTVHRKTQERALRDIRSKIAQPLTVPPDYKKGTNFEKRKAKRHHRQTVLKNYQHYNLVFPASNGLPLALNNLNRREFKDALRLAGLDVRKFSFKSLRHTNASIMAEKVGPKRLQKHLGHSSLITSLKFYTHIDDDDQVDFNDRFVEEMYDDE